ncbi:MAG: CPBP family intramembrane glutamic endopeptidase [Caldimonas sp.]
MTPIAPTTVASRTPLFISLGMVLLYAFFAVLIQGRVQPLELRFGPTAARALTEGAIWLYAALALAIVVCWQRRPLASLGLRGPTLATIGLGMGGAVAIFAAGQSGGFVVYSLLHQPMHADAQAALLVGGSVAYAICLAVRAGVIEEVLFRGIAIEQLTTLIGHRVLAAVVATLAFILVHALRFDWVQLVPIAAVSVVLTGLYLWRHDLLANIIAHVVLDGAGLVTLALQRP